VIIMDSQHETGQKRSIGRAVRDGLPTVLLLACLSAIGIWGHHTGWTAPKFSELIGRQDGSAQEDWCIEHNVPDSTCIACNPELAGESADDWCKEHGVPESRCTLCHPEILLTGVAADWCQEHGVPESNCTICHAEIAHFDSLPVNEEDVTLVEPDHAPELVRDPRTCQTHALKVQFASAASVVKAGVRLGQVIERPMTDSIRCNAEVGYDATRFARIASRVSGIAVSVEKKLGDSVVAGEVLALIDAAEVGNAKSELLQASAAVDATHLALQRIQSSVEAGFRTEAEQQAAAAHAREAEIRLFNARQALINLGFNLPEQGPFTDAMETLGIPSGLVNSLGVNQGSANLIPLLAPFDGTVVRRDLIIGDGVDPARTLFEIADTRRMWVTMDVLPASAGLIALGQKMAFRTGEADDNPVTGAISWISTAVDEVTRTIKVRAEVDNEDDRLRANSFGQARIVVRATPNAIAVPSEAVQWEGCCHVVFVRLTDEIFATRKVILGARDAAYTELLVGLLPGEVVATTGSHVLKSEILKSKLGAGCCEASE
jgi:cobalt-zinc-cadmium efflux system membrane fusion protein